MGRVDHRMVFVAGLHRSGTSLLARCLAAHSEVSGLGGTGVPENEGQHLQDVYPPARAYGGPGLFALDPRAHRSVEAAHAPLAEACGDTAEPARWRARRLFEAWAPYWDLSRPVLVEKSPPNLLMLRYLNELYPDAAFVVVLRHPVVVSLATAKWCPMPLPALVEHWLHAHELAAADLPWLRQVRIVRYEHLVQNPERVLGELAGLLGLDGPIPAVGVTAGHSRRYERLWRSYASPVHPLRRAERRRVERTMGERCARFGYDLSDLRQPCASWPSLSIPQPLDVI
ncbi:sulfotransferase [Lipingzhangella sp. LS1_29]|uniref:Sulfotransferase n=1 Tax=Lipingzhangella rawalii TaxID=2055835 RepID=A0ABU2H3D1_9ACTN|nr:sulfotransferase [Lipingzhangella rawalii]MDS1269811.1 sulfotransferase [Lipingzhangella rawalii]